MLQITPAWPRGTRFIWDGFTRERSGEFYPSRFYPLSLSEMQHHYHTREAPQCIDLEDSAGHTFSAELRCYVCGASWDEHQKAPKPCGYKMRFFKPAMPLTQLVSYKRG